MAGNTVFHKKVLSILNKPLISRSEAETKKAAKKFSGIIKPGDLVLLKGGLGSGKTVFARGLARAMGFKGAVRSPSFTIANRYKCAKGVNLYHLDLYRLEGSDFDSFGLEEYICSEGICAVEWGQKIMIPPRMPYWDVRITPRGEKERCIIIKRKNQKKK
ncbi:MAG TPA: tRNA (adenosine(37)-N6)-threonylcarbamoyltransferase complex ATPase subunit type 1 TsaE [Elusimicrobia bacterium]|nr:MAG: tRNA (adenosine(37)-N6)-threonylcarbamoyltransferase complex ATPase subunit type 1 TsaE [Elusimicrobia bacterium RIFOXYA12_FULL_49_49]OGS09149.1 MAG: tRNA (adenosine(37)-N6)-threonylcarbamoyltransferase complex ATPase subunit type 1 TsaE [Elusimicrobia bacterium RIFOXYA1_FULL_47_7]OGS11541.1 MAG: tRNA (adenosine(37)-N6)-threonylcarbamoyltransferase complex ATPase subunit type 1 TsaE [Elusimicrobia bacterium RIFOXYB1_FULL_48_9]OGS14771.1 MAG: tRNA (adenosine(37)-N6)-threonylcarbamoyltrans